MSDSNRMRILGINEEASVNKPNHKRFQPEVNPGTTGIGDKALDSHDSDNRSDKKWEIKEIKKHLKKTKTGAKLLAKLPPKVTFKVFESKEADKHAEFNPTRRAILIPGHLTSLQAAPLAAHEIVHAIQYICEERPIGETMEFKIDDQVAMEVEAKNAGLDVYEELGKPGVPYPYKDESEQRKKDAVTYELKMRAIYRKKYSAPLRN